ncbi:MAG: DNA replication/repair protein RecF [Chloroflexota bacterium]|nr:DNA replication/repair protein RecF [Chloroflexota bacterium]
MYLSHLTMKNFRNYADIELDLSPGLTIFRGANAQGKSNLLEAIYLLALTKSARAHNERDVIRFEAAEQTPYTRIIGTALQKNNQQVEVRIDMAIAPRQDASTSGMYQKRIRVNGLPKPASQAVGAIAAVLFSADDLSLITGPPSSRRRYMDVLLSQVDKDYIKTLQRYLQVMAQRNQLLKRIREGQAGQGELGFWNDELSQQGARITERRRIAVVALAPQVSESYNAMASEDGQLELSYVPSVEHAGTLQEVAAYISDKLATVKNREIQMAQTLVGPHRDELRTKIGGVDVSQYGSRGQIRSVALSLRLAEADYLTKTLGEEPVLLLDDVLSELDDARQLKVLQAACTAEQALVTMVDGERQPSELQEATATFRIQAGTLVQEG